MVAEGPGSLQVSNLTVRQTPRFTPSGGIEKINEVSFMVGDHGPFFLPFPQEEFFDQDVQAAVGQTVARVAQIHAIGQRFGPARIKAARAWANNPANQIDTDPTGANVIANFKKAYPEMMNVIAQVFPTGDGKYRVLLSFTPPPSEEIPLGGPIIVRHGPPTKDEFDRARAWAEQLENQLTSDPTGAGVVNKFRAAFPRVQLSGPPQVLFFGPGQWRVMISLEQPVEFAPAAG